MSRLFPLGRNKLSSVANSGDGQRGQRARARAWAVPAGVCVSGPSCAHPVCVHCALCVSGYVSVWYTCRVTWVGNPGAATHSVALALF